MGITVQAKPAVVYESHARTTLRRLPTNRSNLRSADGRFSSVSTCWTADQSSSAGQSAVPSRGDERGHEYQASFQARFTMQCSGLRVESLERRVRFCGCRPAIALLRPDTAGLIAWIGKPPHRSAHHSCPACLASKSRSQAAIRLRDSGNAEHGSAMLCLGSAMGTSPHWGDGRPSCFGSGATDQRQWSQPETLPETEASRALAETTSGLDEIAAKQPSSPAVQQSSSQAAKQSSSSTSHRGRTTADSRLRDKLPDAKVTSL